MKQIDAPELRVHKAVVGEFAIYFHVDQWILKHNDLFLAWAIRVENGWRVLEYSGAESELAEIVADGLSEHDAMICLGDIAVSYAERAT